MRDSLNIPLFRVWRSVFIYYVDSVDYSEGVVLLVLYESSSDLRGIVCVMDCYVDW